jgi:hypothetical protein
VYIDVNVKGMGLVSNGLTAKNEVSGLGLHTRGLIWPTWAGFVGPYSSLGYTLPVTSWSLITGISTITTTWLNAGLTASTSWTLFDTIPNDP